MLVQYRDSLDDQRWIKNLVRFGLPAIVLVFYLTASAHFGYTPDDTYIYLQFAKNIVHGAGFAFNAGEPTYGITSPLWLLIVAFGGWIGIDPYIAAKTLDLVIASAALLVFFDLSLRVLGDHVAGLCATLAFSMNVWFLRWAGTGMEASLSVILVLLTVRYILMNEYLLAMVIAGLLSLTRPEAGLFAGLILVDVVLNSRDRRRGWKMVGALSLIYLAVLLPWILYAFSMFGTVVPNTAFAKSALGFSIDDALENIVDIVKTLGVSDGVSLAVIFLGSIVLWFNRDVFDESEDSEPISNRDWLRFQFLPLAWIASLPALYIFTSVNVVSRYLDRKSVV